ncbi:MAG: phage tail tube protein [Nitrososphaerales archaeon]
MSYTPTLGLQVAETAQYAEESTFGTFPTNPALAWVGSDMQYSDSADMGSIKIRNLGSEDLKYVLKGADNYDLTLDYAIQTSAFAKYLVNSQGSGSGSIDKSLAILIAPKINGVAQYLAALGCRPDSGSIKWQLGKELRANVKMFAQSIQAYNVGPPSSFGSGSFAADPGTNPWVFTDPGSSGITIGGTAFDINDLTISFNRNLERVRAIGQSTAKYIVPSVRDITFDVTILLEATSNYSALLNGTSQTIVAPLKSGTSTLTLSNAFFVKQGKSIQCKNILMEKYSGAAESAVLT